MTRNEAIEMLSAKKNCYKNSVSSTPCPCTCDDCELNYAQGNMGEQIEYFDMAIDALIKLDCITRVVNLLGTFKDPNVDYKVGWNDGMTVLAEDIKEILERS